MNRARLLILILFLSLPGAMLAPLWRLGGLGAGEDDILYYYPARVFFHESITAGQWPWINPWTGLDRPYAADPQSAIWYPLTWLFAILPPIIAYPTSLWLHFSIALWGMYRLLRSIPSRAGPAVAGRSTPSVSRAPSVSDGSNAAHADDADGMHRTAAIFGAVAFAFCGFILAHRVHLSMHHAAVWAPWVFWRFQRYAHAGGMTRLAAAAGVAAMQCFAGHVQIAAFTALGSLVLLMLDRRSESVRSHVPRVALRWLLMWVCAAGLFAVQWMPTLAALRLSTRTDANYWLFTLNSWNPASALGWIMPMLFGQRTPNFFDQEYWGPSHQVEQFSYVGILPLVLSVLALVAGWRSDPRRRPWVWLGVFALLLALGRYGPVCPILYWLPGAAVFHVPARALLLFQLAVAVLAATVVHDLVAAPTPRRARLRWLTRRWTSRPILTALLLAALPILAVAAVTPALGEAPRRAALAGLHPGRPAIFIPVLVLMASFATLGHVARQWRQPVVGWLLVLAVAVDLAVVGWTIDIPAGASRAADLLTPPVVRPSNDAAEQPGDDWLRHLDGTRSRLWVVTAHSQRDGPGEYRNSLGKRTANTNALVQVRSLTDYGPLQPRALQARFAFTPWGESANARELLAETTWMRSYNVGWILLCEPEWPAPVGCDLITTTADGMRLYQNPSAEGPAFLADPSQLVAIRHFEHTPYSWTTIIDAAGSRSNKNGDAWLIVSNLALPGWHAVVDGAPATIEPFDPALLAVRVPAGRPVEIRWSYFPPGLRIGAAVSTVSAFVLGCCVVAAARKRDRTTRANGSQEGSESDSG
ncbi:MAG: hypothetical protein IH986_12815 [Planctomycetes bacterium]|nr:hypothetical protein [Planctomycetota bacterium]